MKKTYSPDYVVINPMTGETEQFPNGFTLFTRDKEQDNYKAELTKRYGNFVWAIFAKENPYLYQISPNSLAKLFYLATFMTYENSLAFVTVNGRKTYLTRSDLRNELKLSENSFYNFYREVMRFGILEKKDGVFYLSRDYFRKGKLGFRPSSSKSSHYAVRIFIPAMRSLYMSITMPQKHYLIGYLIRMLPDINQKYNILCDDPKERCAKKIKPIPFVSISEKVGYNAENARHLVRKIARLTFYTKNDKENCPIAIVKAGITKWKIRRYTFINPYLFYGGTDISEVSGFGQDLKL